MKKKKRSKKIREEEVAHNNKQGMQTKCKRKQSKNLDRPCLRGLKVDKIQKIGINPTLMRSDKRFRVF